MIRVLIVDDDKLVRQGLISAMPWGDYGMRVIGEANNGEKALEFLKANQVDLLLTDLAMPVMSGIELMREARTLDPSLFIVVLTLHQDFEYVQEALRLGAIDYIAKVQLERERFEEVLGRVHQRLLEERRKGSARSGAAAVEGERLEPDAAWFLLVGAGASDEDAANEASPIEDGSFLAFDDGVWWRTGDESGDAWRAHPARRLEERPGRMLLHVTGLQGVRRQAVARALRAYRSRDFFYDYDPGRPLTETTFERLQSPPPELDEERFADVRARWLSMAWLRGEEPFGAMARELREARLAPSRLTPLLYVIENEWNRVFVPVSEKRCPPPDGLGSWTAVEDWLRGVRRLAAEAAGRSPYSEEVTAAIWRAIAIVKEESDRPLYASEAARRVNMSRSYFSQCFKDIAGKPFNEYVRTIRIEKAKAYLRHTNQSIQWIAERTGYADEKYFSRLFREVTGMLPSEYRAKRQGGETSETRVDE